MTGQIYPFPLEYTRTFHAEIRYDVALPKITLPVLYIEQHQGNSLVAHNYDKTYQINLVYSITLVHRY